MEKNRLETKNSIIGYLVSFIFHLAIVVFIFFMIHKKDTEITAPPPPKGQELKLSDFNAPPPMPSQTQPQKQAVKPTPPVKQQQQKQQVQKEVKQVQKEPDITKTPLAKQKEQKDHNATKEVQKVAKQAPTEPQKAQPAQSQQAPQASSSSGSSLLDALNTKIEKQERKEVGAPIKELYGKEFDQMTPAQQKFIQDNLSGIGRITQQYLRYPELAGRANISGQNVVEFMLMPNGDITDLKLMRGSGYEILDDNSIKTIKLAYKDYPRPSTPTKIRIFVRYSIY